MNQIKYTRLFLVEKIPWFANPFRRGEYCRVMGIVPLKAYTDEGKAEADCRKRDLKVWAKINPFLYGSKLDELTSFDGGRLRDWFLDAGLEPPPGRFSLDKWRSWYDTILPKLTELQRLKVRDAFDNLLFFRVSELTA
jgi:hypothetical protein